LFINKVDDCGQIKKHPIALKEAYRLGSELVSSATPPPKKTIDVELT